MIKYLSIFSLLFLFAFSVRFLSLSINGKRSTHSFSQPKNQIDTNTFKKISTLRSQGELALQNGDIEKSEKILNEALALFK